MEPKKGHTSELILLSRPDTGLRAGPPGAITLQSTKGINLDEIKLILKSAEATIEPLFGETEEKLIEETAAMPSAAAAMRTSSPLENFYSIVAHEEELYTLAKDLRTQDFVEAAYVKPPGYEPQIELNNMQPLLDGPPNSQTPNYESRQNYLGAAPVGVDAEFAWSCSGGKGDGVRIIDCEWGWNFNHEDLQLNSLGLVFGSNSSNSDHGTAVIGAMGGDENDFGVTGICPNARIGASSFLGQPTARTIRKAAQDLQEGDIILLEIHRPGPNANGNGQKGFIPVEWWPDDFAAIRYAISKGIIVVEAAGNGWEDLDDNVYDHADSGFPSSWTNPLNPNNPSSDAVLVGAGCPPPGTHGRDLSPWNLPYVDRARCGFSNWGSRVDCQGWGWEVTTTGYGELQGGVLNQYYTDSFSGTSSASPIVTGVIACLQGIQRDRNLPLLTSSQAIELLRSTGSPQQSAPPERPGTQRVGNRPDLKALIEALEDNFS